MVPIEIPLGLRIEKVSCGYWHTLCLTDTGIAMSAGYGKNGELARAGSGDTFGQIEFSDTIIDIVAGFGVSFFIASQNNYLYSCGKQYLNAQQKASEEPILVKQFPNGVKQVVAGYKHFGCIDISGDLYMWGDNLVK